MRVASAEQSTSADQVDQQDDVSSGVTQSQSSAAPSSAGNSMESFGSIIGMLGGGQQSGNNCGSGNALGGLTNLMGMIEGLLGGVGQQHAASPVQQSGQQRPTQQ